MEIQRETLPVDVLFVGGGPAALAGALHLVNRWKALRAQGQGPEELQVALIDKSAALGSHGISGAVLNPVALAELVPDYREKGAPLELEIREDAVRLLTRSGHFRVPGFLVPKVQQNHGHWTVSLGKLVAWLGKLVEESGVFVFTGTTGVEVLWDGDRVRGVRTGDKGLDRAGAPKANFEPGVLIEAKVTVFAEGPYGTLTEDVIHRLGLREDRNPQVYALGVKELIQARTPTPGTGLVMHTLGWPLPGDVFGGGFLYEMAGNRWAAGFVAGLGWKDPGFDVQERLQRWKRHPLIRPFLDGGEVLSYGAKCIPEGGWFSLPRLHADGALIAGDAAGFVHVRSLKGIHYAMKTGMLAAETALDALVRGDAGRAALSGFDARVRDSWVGKELWDDRNFRQCFDRGLFPGLARLGFYLATGGGPRGRVLPVEADHRRFEHASRAPRREPAERPDGVLFLDKLTDVHRSGTMHREDGPSHIRIVDPKACVEVCYPKHGDWPCTHFCPAQVYEKVEDAGGPRIQVNYANCVHCKTCVILDPIEVDGSDHIQNIDWRAPAEGGPKYADL